MTKKPTRSKASPSELPKAPQHHPRSKPAKDGSARGRPTDLTPAVWGFVMEMVAKGVPESVIGPAIPDTVHHRPLARGVIGAWRSQGLADKADGRASIFADFSDALREASRWRKDSFYGNIVAAQGKDWRAAFALLRMEERRELGLPLTFDPSDIVPPPPPAGGLPSAPDAVPVITDDDRARLLARARALRDADAVQLKPRKK